MSSSQKVIRCRLSLCRSTLLPRAWERKELLGPYCLDSLRGYRGGGAEKSAGAIYAHKGLRPKSTDDLNIRNHRILFGIPGVKVPVGVPVFVAPSLFLRKLEQKKSECTSLRIA